MATEAPIADGTVRPRVGETARRSNAGETLLTVEAVERSMAEPLLTHGGPLVAGTIVDRPNRFVLRVRFDDDVAQVHLGDPGVLPAVLAPGNEILCSPVDDDDRVTAYDAIAVRTGDAVVGVRSTLANDLFERALSRGALPGFGGDATVTREPQFPDAGRADFLLESADGEESYVEVKSCSLARDGIARFPDRSTERGRRQIRSLERLATEGTDCHLVFVVQRPDVAAFRPLREVDPAFADRLKRASSAGVDVRAIVTPFEAPHYHLADVDLPVVLGANARVEET